MAVVHSDSKASNTTLQFGVDVGQYLCVNFDHTTGLMQLPRVEGHRAIGVTQEAIDFSENPWGGVRCIGFTKVVLGGTVVAGRPLMAQTTGKMIAATGANNQSAISMQSGVANDVIEVKLIDGGEATLS